MLRGLRTVGYPVADLDRAKAFYTELLGYGPYFDQPFYVGFEVGGYELGLVPGGTPSTDGSVSYWAVDDMDRAIARLEELGARILSAPQDVGEGIVVASVADPFGNRLGLIVNPHFRAEVGAEIAADDAGTSDQRIVHEVVVGATPEEVWRLWTTADGIRSWLGVDCRVEGHVGGAFELYFLEDGAPGLRGSEGCRFLTLLRPRLLSFTWNAPPHLKTRPKRTQVVVELEPVEGGTRARLTHAGWPEAGLADAGSDWPATFAYFEQAWGKVCEALRRGVGGTL